MNPFVWFLMVVSTKEFGKRFVPIMVVVLPMWLASLYFVNNLKLLIICHIALFVAVVVGTVVCYVKADKELKDSDNE